MTAIAVSTHAGLISMYNTSAHGFTEALYAYTSQGNNNGSASPGTPAAGYNLADYMGGAGMMLGRFVLIITTLCVAGSLAGKRVHPAGAGTLRDERRCSGS